MGLFWCILPDWSGLYSLLPADEYPPHLHDQTLKNDEEQDY